MITIKESKPHDPAPHGENYGKGYQAQISAATARQLCGMYPVPKIGYEIVVAMAVNSVHKSRLCVANVSGDYFVRSSSWSIDFWPEIFGVTVQRKEVKA